MTKEDIKTITDIVHKTIYGFFDVCGDDEETPMTDKDKLLLKINKALCNNIKALEQEPKTIQEKQAESEKYDKAFEDGYEHGYAQARFDYEQEPCEDCVSRQAALDAMCALCNTGETLKENPWRDNPHIDAIIDALDNLPPINPQQKIGRWIDDGFYSDGWSHKAFHCSECGHNILGFKDDLKIECPNCRCKMQEVEE